MRKILFIEIASIILTLILCPVVAEPVTETAYVRMLGKVSSYGARSVCGGLCINAKIGEWARVFACFFKRYDVSIPELPFPPIEFIYVVTLGNASTVELDYMGMDFYINGTWEVRNVTWTGQSLLELVKAVLSVPPTIRPGELYVTGGWQSFVIDITDFELIRGEVIFYCIRKAGPISNADVDGNYKVDMMDIGYTCLAFGTHVGLPNYNFYADVDFNCKVDMMDIGEVCLHFGTKY